jgi:hypothetical protein
MITSEQITEIVNECKQTIKHVFDPYRDRADKADTHIAQLQYEIQQLKVHQTALKDKLHYLQLRIDNPGAEPNQHDALGEHSADKILRNPVMDRQEYPQGMREWEIVEFRAASDKQFDMHISLNRKGYCNCKDSEGDGITLNDMLSDGKSVKSGHYSIHSVRRLSDGEVFTVGDKINYGPIKDFFINNCNEMLAHCDTQAGWAHLSVWKKHPSFTTADGAVVLEGYNIWFMHPEKAPVPTVCKAMKGLNWDNHYSSKEAAEAAYKAAVLFVTADGVAVFDEETEVWSWNDMNIFSWQLKYGLDPARPWFSTRTAAEAAYNKWLYDQPVLSLNDLYQHPLGDIWEEIKQIVKEKISKP